MQRHVRHVENAPYRAPPKHPASPCMHPPHTPAATSAEGQACVQWKDPSRPPQLGNFQCLCDALRLPRLMHAVCCGVLTSPRWTVPRCPATDTRVLLFETKKDRIHPWAWIEEAGWELPFPTHLPAVHPNRKAGAARAARATRDGGGARRQPLHVGRLDVGRHGWGLGVVEVEAAAGGAPGGALRGRQWDAGRPQQAAP